MNISSRDSLVARRVGSDLLDRLKCCIDKRPLRIKLNSYGSKSI